MTMAERRAACLCSIMLVECWHGIALECGDPELAAELEQRAAEHRQLALVLEDRA